MIKINFKDVINGREASAVMTYNARVYELAHLVSFEMNHAIQEDRGYTLGNRSEQAKPTGIANTGSIVAYLGDPVWGEMVQAYQDTGIKQVFDLVVTNNDPSSAFGAQTIAYYGCSISTASLGRIDISTTQLQQTLNVSCDSFKILERFSEVS